MDAPHASTTEAGELYSSSLPELRRQLAQSSLPRHQLRPIVISAELLADSTPLVAVTSADLAAQYLTRVLGMRSGSRRELVERLLHPLAPGAMAPVTIVTGDEGHVDVRFAPLQPAS